MTDPAQADMIKLVGANEVGAGESTDVTFTATSSDDLNKALSAVDTWGCITRYYAEGSEIIPTTTFPEQLKVSNNTRSVSVTKTVDKTKVEVGGTLVYTIKAKNTGQTTVTDYDVTDTLPEQLKYASNTGGGIFDEDSNSVTWTIATLAPGEETTFTVTTTALEAGSIKNKVTITEPDGTPEGDDDTDVDVDPKVEPTITKTVDRSQAEVGQTLTYTITVDNPSTTALTNYYVVDTMPSQLTYVSCTGDGTYDEAAGTITWNIASLEAGGSTSFTVVTTAAKDGTAANVATVNKPDATDSTKPGDAVSSADATVTITAVASGETGSIGTGSSTVSSAAVPKTADATNKGIMMGIGIAGLVTIVLALAGRRRRED